MSAIQKIREKDIEKAVTNFAKSRCWLSYKWVSPNQKGVPDRIYFNQGEVLIIEFKAPGKQPKRLQKHVHCMLNNEGFTVHVIDNIETGCALFR